MATRLRRRVRVRRAGMVVDMSAVGRQAGTREGPWKRELGSSLGRMRLVLRGMVRMGRRRSTPIQRRQSSRHRRRAMGIVRTPGEGGVLGKRGRRLRRMLLILLLIAGIERMGLVRRRVDGEARLLRRRLGIVGRRSSRHDGRVCRPQGGEVLLKEAASTKSRL